MWNVSILKIFYTLNFDIILLLLSIFNTFNWLKYSIEI